MSLSNDMIVLLCCDCHVPFAITERHNEQLKKSKDIFCCPNGHEQSYTGDRESERLRKELEELKNRHENVMRHRDNLYKREAHLQRQLSGMKGQCTMLRNKIKKTTTTQV